MGPSTGVTTTLAYLFMVFICHLLCLVIYRLRFHALAKYPGPLLARITDLYCVYHCWLGDSHLNFSELHRRYGDFVRLGPNRLSVNTITALRDIYGANANVQKAQFYTAFSHFFKVPMIVTTIDRKQHGFKKRILYQSLTKSAISEFEECLLTSTRTFCALLIEDASSTTWGSVRNMTDWTTYLTSDIMGQIALSRNWNMMESTKNRPITNVISQGVAGLNLAGHMPGVLKLNLDKILFRDLMNGVKDFLKLSQEQMDWRLAHGEEIKTKDLFATLVEAKDPESGNSLSEEQIVAETSSLLLAGSDTQATTLSATLFYCLHYPPCLAILQDEIRSTFSDADDIRIGSGLDSCKYLRACIDEALRLSPPIGGLLQREVLPGGLTIEGESIPPGVIVGVPHYAIQHSDAYYPEPYSFIPERWIAGLKTAKGIDWETFLPRAQSAFCAFGVGRTSCVGKTLAYTEMSIILARMIWSFDMRLQAGSTVGEGHARMGPVRSQKNEFQTFDQFFSSHDGPLVEFKRR